MPFGQHGGWIDAFRSTWRLDRCLSVNMEVCDLLGPPGEGCVALFHLKSLLVLLHLKLKWGIRVHYIIVMMTAVFCIQKLGTL